MEAPDALSPAPPAPPALVAGARPRRLVIVGAVAAGTSTGTQARRNDPSLDIVIYERGRDASFSACGIPLLLGGHGHHPEQLNPRDPAWFAEHHGIDVRPRREVVAVDHATRSLNVRNLHTGEQFVARSPSADAIPRSQRP